MGNLDAFKFNKDSERRMRIRLRNLLRDPRTTSKPAIPLDTKEEDIPSLDIPSKEDIKDTAQTVGVIARIIGFFSR